MIENSEKPMAEEPPKCHCETCQYFLATMVNPNLKIAIGPCTNDQFSDAPFGVAVAHFATCGGYLKRENTPKIAIPKKIVSRLG